MLSTGRGAIEQKAVVVGSVERSVSAGADVGDGDGDGDGGDNGVYR